MSKEIAIIEKQINPVLRAATELKITDQKSMKLAAEVLSQINKALDTITDDKEKLTKPLNETLKEIRARYKPGETKLTEARDAVRKEMSRYQTEFDAVALNKKDAIAERVGEGKGKLKAETAERQIAEVKTPDEVVNTDHGSVKFRTTRNFEVIDMKKLPLQYHIPDEVEIRKAMKQAVELPGVRYFDEKIVVNSR